MTAIQWDQSGERVYEFGVDRGVIYLPEGNAVPWNGLISVSEKSPNSEGNSIHFDGVKYGNGISVGDFAATIKAYTYPDEILDLEGIEESGNGLYLANQRPKRFSLSYRTKVGSDEDENAGYKIHVVYNLTLFSAQKNYETSLGENPMEFEWAVTAIPEEVSGFRPTAHLIFDSREMGELLLEDIERTLYGDFGVDPKLPALETLVNYISNWVIMRVTDNFDGTWTIEGPDEYFTMISGTEFEIIQANAVYLDANTYNVSDTTY